jgi:hypothetical protein
VRFVSAIIILFLLSLKVQAANILLIGDSHLCGAFGIPLEKQLTSKGNNVDVFCAELSSASNWVQGVNPPGKLCRTWTSFKKETPCGGDGQIPKIDSVLKRKKYDKAVIALGTNSTWRTQVDDNFKSLAKKIRAKINSCVWIGPPRIRSDQALGFNSQNLEAMDRNLPYFYASLYYAVNKTCTVWDSREATKPTVEGGKTEDGIHRTVAAGEYWSQVAWSEVFNPQRAPASDFEGKILLRPAKKAKKKP